MSVDLGQSVGMLNNLIVQMYVPSSSWAEQVPDKVVCIHLHILFDIPRMRWKAYESNFRDQYDQNRYAVHLYGNTQSPIPQCELYLLGIGDG